MLLIYLLESETTEENDSLYSRSSSSSGQNDSLEGRYKKKPFFFERVSFYLQFKLKHAMNLCFYNKNKLKTKDFFVNFLVQNKKCAHSKVSYLIANS